MQGDETKAIEIDPAHLVKTTLAENFGLKQKSGSTNACAYDILWHLLYIKFSFQVGNTMFESLFAQHMQDNLGLTGKDIGFLLGIAFLLVKLTFSILLKLLFLYLLFSCS